MLYQPSPFLFFLLFLLFLSPLGSRIVKNPSQRIGTFVPLQRTVVFGRYRTSATACQERMPDSSSIRTWTTSPLIRTRGRSRTVRTRDLGDRRIRARSTGRGGFGSIPRRSSALGYSLRSRSCSLVHLSPIAPLLSGQHHGCDPSGGSFASNRAHIGFGKMPRALVESWTDLGLDTGHA
ncbi:transmembrane protein, putative [Rhizoctonia solani AG-3 Rhs1AP]|uniref:Transmembrane protein, putative n=2 Tax=Rhizoctonia solani AG-3 TaxID=1086053 RepID=X8J4L0_9AGAM|nr:transmembrane protein, putative [Rhizoctonia solani AG-3 Rhs1AP]KEP53716.1 putative transmembrane protein [Rhizoctonia solani 123E]